MTNKIYTPAQNTGATCGCADYGMEAFALWETQFPMLQLLNQYKSIRDTIVETTEDVTTQSKIQYCNIRLRGLRTNVTPAPYLDVPTCGSGPQPITHDTIECESRIYTGTRFLLGVKGSNIFCDKYDTADSLLMKTLHYIYTENLPTWFANEFLKNFYASVAICKGKVNELITYDKFSAMPTLDMSSKGIVYESLVGLISKYVTATRRTLQRGTKLVMLIDQTNFNLLEESIKALPQSKQCCGDLSGNLVSIWEEYGYTGRLQVPGLAMEFIPLPDDSSWERDATGNPIFPVYNPNHIGFDLAPIFNGPTLESAQSQQLSKHTNVNLGYNFAADLYTSHDSPHYTPGYWAIMYFMLMVIKMFPQGQFFIKGKAHA